MINIHNSYNAKALSISSLCDSFIVSEFFSKIAGVSHSILIGPRGSGKTTLLKMLQVQALNYWDGDDAAAYKNDIDYVGVFIPTDRLWKDQYQNICNLKNDSHNKSLWIVNSIFIYHIVERIVAALEFRISSSAATKKSSFMSIKTTKEQELNITKELSKILLVNPKIATIKSLVISIKDKQSFLASNILNKNLNTDCIPDTFSLKNIINTIDSCIHVINLYLEEHDRKWCLLFDELELAPEEVVGALIKSIRGGPENIILKLSLSPYHGNIKVTNNPYSPMPGQDHTVINLTKSSITSSKDFSKKLCEKIFSKKGLKNPIESYFEEPKKISPREEFLELARKDQYFCQYLNSHNIKIENFDQFTEKDLLPTIRKIQFVVSLRNYSFSNDLSANGEVKKRSRKVPHRMYFGFHNLCKSMEYNPRMLITMCNLFLELINSEEIITIEIQSKVLNTITQSYYALLNTIPIKQTKHKTLMDFIKFLLERSGEEIYGSKFKAEPYNSFSLNDSSLVETIGLGLNSGALIAEELENENPDLSGSNNINFRLSYIFSHDYGLLLSTTNRTKFETFFNNSNIRQMSLNENLY